MTDNEIILEYNGKVTFNTINPLLFKLKGQSDFKKLNRGYQKRLYSVFVECIENIYKYEASDVDRINHKKPYIRLAKQDDQFIIRTGNIIANKRIEGLQARLEQIKKQDHKGLRASYARIIDQEIISTEEGAGLGLITIALRSDNRFSYNFTLIDPEHSYFEMKIFIPTWKGSC